ncbi:MAG: cell envelope integrity protein TolA [Deltaproteobacteria bacterium]
MAGNISAPTISLRERSIRASGSEERLSKWLGFSLFLHAGLIVVLFITPLLPSRKAPDIPVYTVDLIGGEKIGGTNFGTELPAPTKVVPQKEKAQPERAASVPEPKPEPKKEKTEKKETLEKTKAAEKLVIPEKKPVLKETAKKEAPKKEASSAKAGETAAEESAADRVRERLIQSAVERAKSRSEQPEKTSKGEVISSGTGEGEGAAALGPGGRGGGVAKGMDFIIYQNRMLSTIKGNWTWVGGKSNLRVVVRFNIKDSGEIAGLKIVQPSGDPSYDESVLRAVRKSSPLPAPPDSVRKDFAEVTIRFRPEDLGA